MPFLRKHTTLLLLCTIFAIALFLRSYRIGNSPFGFDQVQIAQEATRIVHGDFTLIGPRTGPAEMFTGPLIYYGAALFTLLLPAHWSVVATAITISFITGLVLYALSRRYLNPELALILTALWAISPFFTELDRIPWNPNLTLLASSMVFFPLLRIQDKKSFGLLEILLISAGIFLGYQAHFSGFLLLPLAVLTLLLFSKNRKSLVIIFPVFGLALFTTLLPTLLFDLKNHWLNARGLWTMVSDREQVSYYQMFHRLGNKVFIAVETLGKLILHRTSLSLVLVAGAAGLVLTAWIFLKHRSSTLRLQIAIVWLVAVIGVFTLYRRPTPEYYFLILGPTLLLMWTLVIEHTLTAKQRWVLLGALAAFSVLTTLQTTPKVASFSLTQQLDATAFVQQKHQEKPLHKIVFDMEPVESLGLQYLLAPELSSLASEGAVLHLAYPYHESRFVTQRFSHNFTAWIDSRVDETSSYLTTPKYIFRYPAQWRIVENLDQRDARTAEKSYLVLDEDQVVIGQLLVFDFSHHPELVEMLDEQTLEMIKSSKIGVPTTWTTTEMWEQPALLYLHEKDLFIFLPGVAAAEPPMIDVLVQ